MRHTKGHSRTRLRDRSVSSLRGERRRCIWSSWKTMYVKLIQATSGRWQLGFGSSIHRVFCMLSETNAVLPIHFPLESVNTMEKKQHSWGSLVPFPLYCLGCTAWNILRTEVLPSHTWLGELELRLEKHLPGEGWLTVKASVSGVGASPVKEMKAASWR